MKYRFGAALLALSLLALPAVPARADCDPFAPHLPYRVECGINPYFRVLSQENGWGCQLGPWYNYWPLEAHFQTPALPCYPYWPAPQALLPGGATTAAPCPPAPPAAIPTAVPRSAPAPAVSPAYYRPVTYQPVGYYSYPQAPAYWYGGR